MLVFFQEYLLTSQSAPQQSAVPENQPYYPEQGNFVAAHAVYSLLPAGVDAQKARVLFIHAHPDDESTSTGATMGALAEEGAQVDLLTLTRGEMGEVIPEDLKHLEAAHPGTTDFGAALGEYRAQELAQALVALGVDRHFFLGQDVAAVPGGRKFFRDSGMVWGADGRAAANPDAARDCLTALNLEEEASGIAAVIRERRPHVVVTYDHGGGYGHPDHLRTYEASMKALEMVAGSDAEPLLVWGLEGEADPADTRQQAVIQGSLMRKRAAMQAHRTQIIVVDDETFQYSNLVEQKISARETYRLLQTKVPDHTMELNSLGGNGPLSSRNADIHPSVGNSVLTGIALGLLVGFIGTMYHASIWYINESFYIPWGALVALILVFSAATWNSLRAGRNWAGSLVGIITFLVIALFAFAKPHSILVLVNPAVPVGVAGTIWMLGSLGATIVSNITVTRLRHRSQR